MKKNVQILFALFLLTNGLSAIDEIPENSTEVSFTPVVILQKAIFTQDPPPGILSPQGRTSLRRVTSNLAQRLLTTPDAINGEEGVNPIKVDQVAPVTEINLPLGDRRSLMDRRVKFHLDLHFTKDNCPECFEAIQEGSGYRFTYKNEGSTRFLDGYQDFKTKSEMDDLPLDF